MPEDAAFGFPVDVAPADRRPSVSKDRGHLTGSTQFLEVGRVDKGTTYCAAISVAMELKELSKRKGNNILHGRVAISLKACPPLWPLFTVPLK